MCVKNGEHKYHTTLNFFGIMPSSNDINNINQRIIEKSSFYINLIEKIDIWKKEIIKKVEELKQNLRDEISLFQKIILNYNNNIRNYIYFENFNYINSNINNNSNNHHLLKLYNTNNFEKQTEIFMTIFKNMGRKIDIIQKKNGSFNTINKIININHKFIEKIDEKYFINYSNIDKAIFFLYFDDNSKNIFSVGSIPLNEEVYSIHHSTIENKIFVCLLII